MSGISLLAWPDLIWKYVLLSQAIDDTESWKKLDWTVMHFLKAELEFNYDWYFLLGHLKLIVCFASTPSYNFQDLSEKNPHSFSFKILRFHWIFCVLCFCPRAYDFDAKHTINFKRPYVTWHNIDMCPSSLSLANTFLYICWGHIIRKIWNT